MGSKPVTSAAIARERKFQQKYQKKSFHDGENTSDQRGAGEPRKRYRKGKKITAPEREGGYHLAVRKKQSL